MKDKPRLGRGLDALIGAGSNSESAVAVGNPDTVPIDRIQHNPYQPRKTFDQDELAGLSDSIRVHGILQPLVVRNVGDHFQLIAGERRLRAAQAAGISEVPVRVVDFNDQQVLEAALVENIQRADLNPIEKAQGFREYLERFQMTHEQLAARLGLQRSTITNLVSLLELPPELQEAVRVNQITLGHAKILKGIKDRSRQLSLCKEIIARGLSVHATESLVKEQRAEPETPPAGGNGSGSSARSAVEKTSHVQSIEDELRQKLLLKVEIKLRTKDKGQIILNFESNDDFERILDALR